LCKISSSGKRKAVIEIIELSDSDDEAGTTGTSLGTLKKPVPRKRVKLEQASHADSVPFIDLTDSDPFVDPTLSSSSLPLRSQSETVKSKGKNVLRSADASIKITASEYVAEIITISEIPTGWDPSPTPIAYLLDLSQCDATYLDEEKDIIGLIRHEVRSLYHSPPFN
jgi:hypothetical protein